MTDLDLDDQYAWLITTDERPDYESGDSLEGHSGPEGAPGKLITALRSGGQGRAFVLVDDDGRPRLHGRLIAAQPSYVDEDVALAPLEDVGHAYGCTAIRYRRHASRPAAFAEI